jgi:hypothetical protein
MRGQAVRALHNHPWSSIAPNTRATEVSPTSATTMTFCQKAELLRALASGADAKFTLPTTIFADEDVIDRDEVV